MDKVNSGKWSAGLPYINNILIIFVVASINLVIVSFFFLGKPITLQAILVDACICGVTTACIDVFYVFRRIKRRSLHGGLPADVPQSKFMAAMPQNPLWLSLIFGVVFGLFAPLFNMIIIRFYAIETYTFARFLVWRLVYSCVLSAKIIELAILRYVQPDFVSLSGIKQQGTDAVKNPLPRISTFQQWYHTIVEDFGFNLLFGLLLGTGAIIRDNHVIIPPTTLRGIVLSSLISGIIITARMVYAVAKSIRAIRENGQLPVAEKENKWVSWLPASPVRFALVLLLPVMALSLLTFWSVLSFFGFETLNLVQFFFIRILYTSLLSRLVAKLAMLRYIQPRI